MLTKGIIFKNFSTKVNLSKTKANLLKLIKKKNEVINSLSKNYKYSFKKNQISTYKKHLNFRVIGMGGSSLGTQAIYEFLKFKIKKKFYFIDNLQKTIDKRKKKKVCKFDNIKIWQYN